MNSTPTTNENEIRRALDDIARNFQIQNGQRFVTLLPYQNQVRDLRSQNASFRAIARLLKGFDVKTSRETVRRFYYVVIEHKQARRKRTHTTKRRKLEKRNARRKIPMPLSPQSVAKPRIARIEEL